MSSEIQPAKVDENKLNQFIGQMLGDLGGANSVAMVRLGGSLKLYETLHANGPMTSVATCQSRQRARAISARMAVPPGGIQLSGLRSNDGKILATAGAGDGVRARGQPSLHDGRLSTWWRPFSKISRRWRPPSSPAGCGLGRSSGLHVLCSGALLQARIPELPCAAMVAGA